MSKREALERYLDACGDGDSIVDENEVGWFETEHRLEFVVYTEDEAFERVRKFVEENCDAIEPRFLSKMTGISEDAFDAFDAIVGKGEIVYLIIENTCGIDAFVEEIVENDGYGSFISTYDGEKIELDGGYMAFRV